MKPTKLPWAACAALTLGLFGLIPLSAFGAESDSHRADSQAIKTLFADFNEAFNKHDAHAVAMLFTEGGDFVTFAATTFHGKTNIDKWMQQVFARVPALQRGATLRDIHFLTPDTALLYSDFKTSGLPTPGGSATDQAPGFYDWVVMKEHGRWRIALWHESDLPRRTAPPPPAR